MEVPDAAIPSLYAVDHRAGQHGPRPLCRDGNGFVQPADASHHWIASPYSSTFPFFDGGSRFCKGPANWRNSAENDSLSIACCLSPKRWLLYTSARMQRSATAADSSQSAPTE